ncbi:MAG: hypothetical protein RSD14_02700, partial [Clostridia bacterium]
MLVKKCVGQIEENSSHKICDDVNIDIKKNKNSGIKRGISLMVLIVTIVVIVILAGAVILGLNRNNPIKNSKEAVTKSDMDEMRDKYSLVYGKLLKEVGGDRSLITQDRLLYVIPEKYLSEFEATNKGIVYTGDDEETKDTARKMGFIVESKSELPQIRAVVLTAMTDRISIKVVTRDSTSGIKDYEYKITQVGGSYTNTNKTSDATNTFLKLNKNTKYTIEVLVRDNAGNEASYPAQDITTLEINMPKISDIISEWTQGPIDMTITWPEEAGITKQWSYTGAENDWNTVDINMLELKIRDNCVVYARGINEAGNVSEVAKKEIKNIDRLIPKLFVPTVSATTSSIQIMGSAVDSPASDIDGSSGIQSYEYSIDDGKTWENKGLATSHTFSNLNKKTEYNVKMKAIDNAKNEIITDPVKVITEELSQPRILLSNYQWTNKDIMATIECENSGSIIKQYSFDAKNWTEYTGPITIQSNRTIYARVIDEAQQSGKQVTLTVTNIDKLLPKVFTPDTTSITNSITVTGSTIDSEATKEYGVSGVNKYSFSIDGGKNWTAKQTDTTYTFKNLTQSTNYSVCMMATDVAGNERISNVLNTNTPAVPGGNENIKFKSTPDLWTNTNVKIEITYPESTTQEFIKKVSTDGSVWNNYTGPITVADQNTTVYAKLVDSTSQSGGVATYIVQNIDKESPTTTIAPNGGIYTIPTGETQATIKARLSAQDTGGSNLKTVQYAWSQVNETSEPTTGWTNYTAAGQDIQKTDAVVGTYYLWTKVIDNAGNRAENIKKSASYTVKPNTDSTTQITMTPSITNWTNTDVGVRITYGSTITEGKLARVQSGTGVVNSVGNVVMQTNGVVYAQATDIAGNKITKTLQITNIDKVEPTTTIAPNGGVYTIPTGG